MNTSRVISKITIYLVATLALGALVLSYDNLVGVASENGITGWKAYIWPLLLDFALIVFSLAVVRNSLLGERQVWPWFLVGLFTVGTLGFNVLHADAKLVSRVMAAVAPIALFLSFETLMSQLKSEVYRQGAIASLQTLQTNVTQEQRNLAKLQTEYDTLTEKVATQQEALKELQIAKKHAKNVSNGAVSPLTGVTIENANVAKQEQIEARRKEVMQHVGAGLSKVEIATLLDVSRETIYRDVKVMQQNGHSNGQDGGQ